jgi:hypothetical protein
MALVMHKVRIKGFVEQLTISSAYCRCVLDSDLFRARIVFHQSFVHAASGHLRFVTWLQLSIQLHVVIVVNKLNRLRKV